jgi:hypothetical protein
MNVIGLELYVFGPSFLKFNVCYQNNESYNKVIISSGLLAEVSLVFLDPVLMLVRE